jgi:hypothetical protein
VLDAALGLGHGNPPDKGSVTLCVACGSALILGEDLQLEIPPPGVWEEVLLEYPYLQKVRERLLDLITAKKMLELEKNKN